MDHEPINIQGPGTPLEFRGVVWSGKMHISPESVMGKMPAYPSPKNRKEVQGFVGIWGPGRTFIPHLAQCFCPW